MKLIYKGDFLSILLILLLSTFALKSLLAPGFYTSHDGENHTTRIAQYYLDIKQGQIPPRFAASFNGNLGSPIFVYIYPLPYILGATIHFLGFTFSDSFKILMASGFIFSQIFAYFWFKTLFKERKAAIIGALFYGWVPYRFLLIYVRGSLSEVLAYTFVPLVFYCISKLSIKNNIKWLTIVAFSIALLLLSQDLVAYITIPLFAIYTIVLSIKEKSWSFFFKAVVAAIWGLLISSFTYFPALFERNYVIFNSVFSRAYINHFVCPWQLVRSPWGYGFDFPGCINDGLSFQIGLTQLLIFVIFFLFIIYIILKMIIHKDQLKSVNGGVLFILAIVFSFVALISVFLMIDATVMRTVWERLNYLHLIDIPWRLLGITALSASFIAAYLIKNIKSGLFFLLLIFALLVSNRNHIYINKNVIYTDQQFLTYTGSATERSEFTPNYGVTNKTDYKNRVDVLSGKTILNKINYNSKTLSFNISVLSPDAQIRINKYYFPGIKLTDNNMSIDQSKINLYADQKLFGKEISESSKGLLNINLQKGNHSIVLKFGETKLRLFSDYLSLFFLLLGIVVLTKYAKN